MLIHVIADTDSIYAATERYG